MSTPDSHLHKAGTVLYGLTGVFVFVFTGLTLANYLYPVEVTQPSSRLGEVSLVGSTTSTPIVHELKPSLDHVDYATRMLRMANNGLYELLATSTRLVDPLGTTTELVLPRDPKELFSSHSLNWPAEASYPQPGAILPFHRIVAYYGNFYSTRMGALGEYPPEVMKAMLLDEVANWEAADPDTPVIPAIDYIAIVAQADPGADGMYRRLMPDSEIAKAHQLAKEIDGILILEVQVGLSDLQTEIERLEKWLIEPDVHLAIDPEFAMHNGAAPGTVIGSVNAEDINTATAYLESLAITHQLPPKVLLVHRFTQAMVQDYTNILTNDYVQIVVVMDGWGPPNNKFNTYYHVVEPEPVQFSGFKVFYKNDLKAPSTGLLTPSDILELSPQPLFIQYQ